MKFLLKKNLWIKMNLLCVFIHLNSTYIFPINLKQLWSDQAWIDPDLNRVRFVKWSGFSLGSSLGWGLAIPILDLGKAIMKSIEILSHGLVASGRGSKSLAKSWWSILPCLHTRQVCIYASISSSVYSQKYVAYTSAVVRLILRWPAHLKS